MEGVRRDGPSPQWAPSWSRESGTCAILCCWVSSVLRSDKQAANCDAMVYGCTGSVYRQRGRDLRATPGDIRIQWASFGVICGVDRTQPVTSVTSQAHCGSCWCIVIEDTETSRSEQQSSSKTVMRDRLCCGLMINRTRLTRRT